MPVDAIPHDVLGVDGADEKLPYKLPVAHTEQDVVGGGQNSNYDSIILVVVCDNEDIIKSFRECRKSKAEAEDGQMSLWVFLSVCSPNIRN